MSIDGYYYKSIITNGTFNNKYIQYESKGNKDKILTINEYLDLIRPYLSDILNNHKTQGDEKWKIHLPMVINFISFKKDSDETCTMHTKSNIVDK